MDATIDTRFLTRLFPNIVTLGIRRLPEGSRRPHRPRERGVREERGRRRRPATRPARPRACGVCSGACRWRSASAAPGSSRTRTSSSARRTEEDVDDPLIGWHDNIRGAGRLSGVRGAPRRRSVDTAAQGGGDRHGGPARASWSTASPWSRTARGPPAVSGRADVVVQQQRSTVTWHRDPDVAAYIHQIVTAGIAQAAARARFVRNPVLLIVVGLALDHLPPGSATVMEWDEVEPDDGRPDADREEDRVRPRGRAVICFRGSRPTRPGTSIIGSPNRRFCGPRLERKGGGSSSAKSGKGRGRRCRRCGSRVRTAKARTSKALAREGFEWLPG